MADQPPTTPRARPGPPASNAATRDPQARADLVQDTHRSPDGEPAPGGCSDVAPDARAVLHLDLDTGSDHQAGATSARPDPSAHGHRRGPSARYGPRGLRERWGRRSITPIALVSVTAAALGVGALAGTDQAQNTARDQLAAGTRVLMWTDPSAVAAEEQDPQSQATPDFRATLTAAGSPVTLQRIVLAVGQATVQPAIDLRPGARASADLSLTPDCNAVGRTDSDASLLNSARAVVRLPGSQHTQEVPLDVVGDPSAVILTMLAPCSLSTYALESSSTDGTNSLLSVTQMSADSSGGLSFTVRSTGIHRAALALALAAPVDSSVRFTLISRPSLPVRVPTGSSARVSVTIAASCPGDGTALPITYGLLRPQIRGRSSSSAGLPVTGWDAGVAAAAVTAAAVRSCQGSTGASTHTATHTSTGG
jgi:hypothetical protein